MRRSDREIKDFDKIVQIIKKCDVCRIAADDYFHLIFHFIFPLIDLLTGSV